MDEHAKLWQLVRAARLLDGATAQPTADGLLLLGGPDGATVMPWPEVARVLGDDDPVHPAPRRRLGLHLALRAVSAAPDGAERLTVAARPLALPPGHPLHPGPSWVQQQVPGGVLDLGLGVSRLLPDQEGVIPLPPDAVSAAGLDTPRLWQAVLGLTNRLAGFALDRAEAVAAASGAPPRVLAGTGGCDGLTLLALPPVRAWLTRQEPGANTGANTGADTRTDGVPRTARVAAPCRDRLWIGESAGDRDYTEAVWMLTAPPWRGVQEPLAVTPDGVSRPSSVIAHR